MINIFILVYKCFKSHTLDNNSSMWPIFTYMSAEARSCIIPQLTFFNKYYCNNRNKDRMDSESEDNNGI